MSYESIIHHHFPPGIKHGNGKSFLYIYMYIYIYLHFFSIKTHLAGLIWACSSYFQLSEPINITIQPKSIDSCFPSISEIFSDFHAATIKVVPTTYQFPRKLVADRYLISIYSTSPFWWLWIQLCGSHPFCISSFILDANIFVNPV